FETFKSKGSGETSNFKRFVQSKDMKEWVAPVSISAVKVLPATDNPHVYHYWPDRSLQCPYSRHFLWLWVELHVPHSTTVPPFEHGNLGQSDPASYN
ncbi:hypothetical protein A2U01_0046976, partial [Trifolium medium]|nr:hypothetical protein [Trifolium medium]